MTRLFRFGVSVFSAESGDAWRDTARTAEAMGFDVFAMPDHLLDILSPFPALVAAADATERLHVATMVLNNDFRHPAMVAREAATAALLTGGRFELGIGAGHAFPEYEAIGLPFDRAATRVERLSEAVPIIRGMLHSETVTARGRHYAITDHRGAPALDGVVNVPPILVGGHGRRLLRMAAREADIVGFTGLGRTLEDGQRHEPSGFTPAAVDERIALVREAAGDRFAQLELNALVQVVLETEDRRAAASGLADRFGGVITPGDVLESPFVLVGTVAQMADDLRSRRERWSISYVTVFELYLAPMAKVIEAIGR